MAGCSQPAQPVGSSSGSAASSASERLGQTRAPSVSVVSDGSAGSTGSAGATRRCDLSSAIASFEGGADIVNCGDLPLKPSDSSYEATRKCVLDAVRAKKTFTASWTPQGIDSELHGAFAGRAY